MEQVTTFWAEHKKPLAHSPPPCPHPSLLANSAGGHPPIKAPTAHTVMIWPEKHKPNRGVPAVPAREA